jgi:hypothetical protein
MLGCQAFCYSEIRNAEVDAQLERKIVFNLIYLFLPLGIYIYNGILKLPDTVAG